MKYFRILTIFIGVALTTVYSCSDPEIAIPAPPESVSLNESVFYSVNLNDRSGDSFKVRVFVGHLTDLNAIFQFPSTAPGTYDEMNFGNYVVSFKAFDESYNELITEKVSVNQWRLSDPENTSIIEYEIKETWDDPDPQYFIYKMAGTSIENDHSLINPFAVMGYPTGLKEFKYLVDIDYPSSWQIGTALPQNQEGFYVANDYDHLADSPFLLGEITYASTVIDHMDIDIWTYSVTDANTSSEIKALIDEVIVNTKEFLEVLPADHYSFLYHFEESAGALEHSYSSVHVLEEIPVDQYSESIKHIAAHEFFHIVTPLNIHSEIIEDFNFVTPTPSQHLWLYEGVTEWASYILRYRNNSLTLDQLTNVFERKMNYNEFWYDKEVSLTEISLLSYTAEVGPQFGNVYSRGAIVAALLDIRLLELSNGEYGLRELILELMETYGPENSFDENLFFDKLVEMTYPEIEEFIEKYIKETEELPYVEYFSKIGLEIDLSDFSLTPVDNPTEHQQYLFERWSINF